jgi:hypothetical protein
MADRLSSRAASYGLSATHLSWKRRLRNVIVRQRDHIFLVDDRQTASTACIFTLLYRGLPSMDETGNRQERGEAIHHGAVRRAFSEPLTNECDT